jgi:hypothetical protein
MNFPVGQKALSKMLKMALERPQATHGEAQKGLPTPLN